MTEIDRTNNPTDAAPFTIDAWQIWHVYSTYVPGAIGDLQRAARDLVASSVVAGAMLSDGVSIWRGEQGIEEGVTTVAMADRGTRATIDFPHDPVPPAYALEGFFTAAWMRYAEQYAFGEESPVPYVRAILGECRLVRDDREVTLYPILKLYATGVLLIELRVFSPEGTTDLAELISRYENLFQETFSRAFVPPAIAARAPFALIDWSSAGLFRRLMLALGHWFHDREVVKRTTALDGGDFTYEACELPIAEGASETAQSLALTIAAVVAYVVSRPRRGLPLVFFGQRRMLTTGNWGGRPHVHLLRFAGQQDSALENEQLFAAPLGCILARVPTLAHGAGFMEKNLRLFDDFGLYMNRAVRLWVYTPSELTPAPGLVADPNYGHVVYMQEVVAELLEYAYALHERLAQTARDPLGDPRELAHLRVLLATLPSTIDRHVHPGELRDVLRIGYAQMGIPELQAEVHEILAAKSDLAQYHDAARTSGWSSLLTFVFGLLAVPSVATDILTPVWKATGWWKPHDTDVAKVFFIGVAVGVVALFLAVLRWVFFRKRSAL